MLIGAHNSIAGGLHNAVDEAVQVGGDTMQIFCKGNRVWRAKPLTDEEVALFRSKVAEAGLERVMVHDSYLINMGNPDDEKRAGAQEAFRMELQRCEALGVAYLNFHAGSHMDKRKPMRDDPDVRHAALERIAACINQAAEDVPGSVKLVIENAAGQGTNVGSTFEEVGALADMIEDQQRLGVCIDTQHTWAAGYDWNDYDAVWDAFDSAVGLDRLVAFHLNDSKQPCGARVDRHDNIGQGHLHDDFWKHLMTDARFRDLAGYLETPRPADSVQIWADEIAYLRGLMQT